MSTDIERIKGVITPEDEVSRIYINFCNPWSKNDSSHKHRLTYPRQLIAYREFLKDGGEIYFKTDDDDLFRDSVEYFPASGYDIESKCRKDGEGYRLHHRFDLLARFLLS